MKLAAAAILSLVAIATYASPAAYSENQVSAEYSAANAPVIVHLEKRTGGRPGFLERIEEIQKSVNYNHHRQEHQQEQDPQQGPAHPRNDYREQQRQLEEESQRLREQRLQEHRERLQQQEQQEQILLKYELRQELQEKQEREQKLRQKRQEQKQKQQKLIQKQHEQEQKLQKLQKQHEDKVGYQDQQDRYLKPLQTVEGENHNSDNTRGFEEGRGPNRLGPVHERKVDFEPAVELVQDGRFDEQFDDEDPSQRKASTKVRLFSGQWFKNLFSRKKSTSASGKQSNSEDSSQNKVRAKVRLFSGQWFKNLFSRNKPTDTSE
ncbi:hypothetical protein BASA83_011688 [Batrachochytrium salamandrivorans]|nr:hypothetical protein BASA83_011688 [Batrachochytrium salamandrivorans]